MYSSFPDIIKDISTDESELISILIYIASSTEATVYYLDVETTSTILSKIFHKINCISYIDILNDILDPAKNYVSVCDYKIFIADKYLYLIILLNCMRKDETSKLKKTELSDEILCNILKCLDVQKKYTVLLLRTLNNILSKKTILSPFLCKQIIFTMQKVALSPFLGSKRQAIDISQTVLALLDDRTKYIFYNIDLIPLRGINTSDLVTLYSAEYIRCHKVTIVKKICCLFRSNLENKDGESLYRRLLQCYPFEDWIEEIWPLFLPYLQITDDCGEFFHSLIKYWIAPSVKGYKAEFYFFLEDQQIDNIFKLHTFLETRRKGFLVENICTDYFCNIQNANLRLRIISTYYKKTLLPTFEKEMFLDFLYSNINYFLDNDITKSVQLFISQLFLYAHNDLKRNTENVLVYSEFLYMLFKFCYGNLLTDLFEVGLQVLQIVLDISKGGHKKLHLLYKLEGMDFYGEGENLLYKKLKSENMWYFEGDELLTRLNCCFMTNSKCNKTLVDLLVTHFPVGRFIDTEVLKINVTSADNEGTLQTYDKISNLSYLIFKSSDVEDLQVYVDVLREKILYMLDSQEITSCGKLLHMATLRIIILSDALGRSLFVKDFYQIIQKCLITFGKVLEIFSTNNSKFGSVKIVESFINNVIFCLNRHLSLLWFDFDKDVIVRSIIDIIEKSNMKRPVTLSAELLKKLSKEMETREEDRLFKMIIIKETLGKMFKKQENKDYRIRRNPETRLVLHALCLHEKHLESPLLKWVIQFLLEVLKSPTSSDESLTAAFHCIEIFVSDNTLHESTLEFIPEILYNSVEKFVNCSWTVRNANLQLAKALIERLYGVSLGLWNRPKDISDLFQLYPQLPGYFFQIISTKKLDERAHMVFQYFLESQVKEKIFMQPFLKISECFQQLFIKVIRESENHYGTLAVQSFVALCRVQDIPAVIFDIKAFIEKDLKTLKKNILSNLILCIQELCKKFRKSFQHIKSPEKVEVIDKLLENLAVSLNMSSFPMFFPTLFEFSFIQSYLNKIKYLNWENNYQGRIWLHNNINLLVANSNSCDVANVCDFLLSHNLPNFVQIKMLSMVIYRFENRHFQVEDIKKLLEMLFKNTVLIDDQNICLLQSFLRVIFVFAKNALEEKIESTLMPVNSKSLYRNMIFVVHEALSDTVSTNDTLITFTETLEKLLTEHVATSEEIDNDILSLLVYYQKISKPRHNFSFCKFVFYFCTNEATYLDAYHIFSLCMGKRFSSILSMLLYFFGYQYIRILLDDSDIIKLYDDLNRGLERDQTFTSSNGFYEIEGDELVPHDILKLLLGTLRKNMNVSTIDNR